MRTNKPDRKLKKRSIAIGITSALIIFIFFGTITVLIPNKTFIRMTTIHFYDYIFLVLTAALSGVYVGMRHYAKKKSAKRTCAAASGAVGGLFSFGCALCNKLLIALLGLTGVVTYFMPAQPILGVASISLLTYAVYKQYRVLT